MHACMFDFLGAKKPLPMLWSWVEVSRVFNKVLSRCQKLWSRKRKKKIAPQAQLTSLEVQVTRGVRRHAPLEKF